MTSSESPSNHGRLWPWAVPILAGLCLFVGETAPGKQSRTSNDLQACIARIPRDAPRRTVDTVADMVKLDSIPSGVYVVVRGYHRPDDDGAGVFHYDASSSARTDTGTVFQPAAGPGRVLRLFDPDGPVFAEWFGARGDGNGPKPHDDQAAINACLGRFARVRLLAKTYGVRGKPTHFNPQASYHAIDLSSGYRIEGSGRDATILKLLDGANPRGVTPGDNYFSVIGNRDFYESADYAVVRDLMIDGNFDGQNKHTTIQCISIRGGGALVERLNLRGYGTGWDPASGRTRECFVVNQSLVYKARNACRQAAVYRNLDFTAPGHNGDVHGHVAEITHITLGGAHNFGDYSWITPKGKYPDFDPANHGENEHNWWPSYGGLVERCVIHDEACDPDTQKSPLHGVTYGNCIGLVVRNNRIENFEGAAVYVMSWWNRDTLITDNEFIAVNCGLTLQVKGSKGAPLQAPRHESVFFVRNHVRLGAPRHFPWSPSGVQLYGQDPGPGTRFRNIVIRGNVIEGSAYTAADGKRRCPVGVTFQVLRACYERVLVEDNVIETPDYAVSAPYVPQEPYSMSMVFFPLARWADDVHSGRVMFRGNRNRDGRELRPILADWHYKNKPTWGEPLTPQ